MAECCDMGLAAVAEPALLGAPKPKIIAAHRGRKSRATSEQKGEPA